MDIVGYTIIEPLMHREEKKLYLALQECSGRRVLVKMLALEGTRKRQRITAFVRENKVYRDLNHPNLVKLHELGESDGYLYRVMDYVQGSDLLAKQTQAFEQGCAQTGYTLTSAGLLDSIYVIKQVASVIQYLDDKGLAHGDLKPSNIILRESDSRTIVSGPGVTGIEITDPESIRYASPERLAGGAPSQVSDIYSLGLILYTLLTGDEVYSLPALVDLDQDVSSDSAHNKESQGPECLVKRLIEQQQDQAVPRLPTHLALFQPILEQMLALDPVQRLQSGAALIAALDQLDDEEIIAFDAAVANTGAGLPDVSVPDRQTPGELNAEQGLAMPCDGVEPNNDRDVAAGKSPAQAQPSDGVAQPANKAAPGVLQAAASKRFRFKPWVSALAVLTLLSIPLMFSAPRSQMMAMVGSDMRTDGLLQEYVQKAGRLIFDVRLEVSQWLAPVPRAMLTTVPTTLTTSRSLDEQPDLVAAQSDNNADELSKQQLAALLESVQRYMMTPDGINAYRVYQQFLSVDPDNKQVQLALDTLRDALLQQAKEQKKAENYQAARALLKQVSELSPDDSQVALLIQKVKQQQDQLKQQQRKQQQLKQQRQDKIDGLIAEAERLRSQGLLLYPADNNAVIYFKSVLKESPQHKEATKALAEIKDIAISEVKHKLKLRRLQRADELLTRLTIFFDPDPRVDRLVAQLDKLRRQREAELRDGSSVVTRLDV